ncbi:hypothetical protein HMPREF9148_00568 [Prevotella sp. F0091]|nr:hypothetical protein HMPREF9148_00568 [Prevotella sp. F0091]
MFVVILIYPLNIKKRSTLLKKKVDHLEEKGQQQRKRKPFLMNLLRQHY